MARTALDLTVEELRSYHPARVSNTPQVAEKWEQAWEVARSAAQLLREQFGAKQVAVFGSLVHRDCFTPWSDIDLAVWGIPAHQFYQAVAAVTGLSPNFQVDVVDAEDCAMGLRQIIESEGEKL
ncbi:nucleotidyltransferase domain-containing protein [Candidatus Poribacteria bacterium]|nr:nucleotidyltransferase domain-containing protein [Candidatus Poribacteria bacterium]